MKKEYCDRIIKYLEENNYKITERKEIPYGMQFRVNSNGVKNSIRIFENKKKKLTLDLSQVKDNELKIKCAEYDCGISENSKISAKECHFRQKQRRFFVGLPNGAGGRGQSWAESSAIMLSTKAPTSTRAIFLLSRTWAAAMASSRSSLNCTLATVSMSISWRSSR